MCAVCACLGTIHVCLRVSVCVCACLCGLTARPRSAVGCFGRWLLVAGWPWPLAWFGFLFAFVDSLPLASVALVGVGARVSLLAARKS